MEDLISYNRSDYLIIITDDAWTSLELLIETFELFIWYLLLAYGIENYLEIV